MINLKSINRYVIKEYCKSLLVVLAVMVAVIFIINLLDEFSYFKSKPDLKFFTFILMTFLKIPNLCINIFPFITLFGGIFYYLKIYNFNEIVSLRVAGYSNIQVIMLPALTSLIIGYVVIFFFVPLSSSSLKIYEEIRSKYNNTKNLVFVNETGIWILDRTENEKNIIRVENMSKNFKSFNKITIYIYDNNNNFIKRIDSEKGSVDNKKWELEKTTIVSANKRVKENFLSKYVYDSGFKIDDIKNYYKNTDTNSLFDIQNEINVLKDKGYSPVDLRIRYQKLMSFPVYLLTMSILSGLMIINLGKTSNYIKYGVYGIVISVILYFLNDLSITIAKSGIISVDLSVWIPIFLITLINLVGITQVNAK